MTTIGNDPAAINLPPDQLDGSGKHLDGHKSSPDAQNNRKVAQGMKPETMTLFEGPPKCACCINWVEEYPDDIKENIEGAEGAGQYALLVRKRKSHNKDNPDPLELDSILIRSPLIKRVLEEVFRWYPGITVKLEHLSFKAPFAPFLHRWTAFEKAAQSEVHEETQKHMKLLYNALAEEVMKNLKTAEDLLSQGVMTFELLWTLFKPGDLVYRPKEKLLYELSQADMQKAMQGGSEFVLFARNIRWDGVKLGYSATDLKISPFEGTKAITDLEAYPIEYYPSPEALKQSLRNRGEKFLSLRGIHHKAYQGVGIQHKNFYGLYNANDPRNFNERIVIDAKTFYDQYPNDKPSLDLLNADLNAKSYKPTGLHDCYDDGEGLEGFHNFHYPSPSMNPKSNQTKSDKDFNSVAEILTDRQLMIATKWVVGYGLKSKAWVSWDVEIIREIRWNDQAMQNLVLPPAHKELILGFVKSQMDSGNIFDDFIENKGRGLVFLLSGPPGVGKTFTVEATAEELRAPIYSFSAIELGFDSIHVERNFGKMLDTAGQWGAVLLLDEADVFLEQRTVYDLERNRLVSVFLRMLEYFNGVLFLTTNRPSQIDEAFQSRIDVHIDYPNLDASSRRMVWKNFFSKSTKPIDINDDELSQLAQISLNGRQIKSLVKQAQLISWNNRSKVNIDDIHRVLSMFKTPEEKDGAKASER